MEKFTLLQVMALYQKELKTNGRQKADEWLSGFINSKLIDGAIYKEGRDAAEWTITSSFNDDGTPIGLNTKFTIPNKLRQLAKQKKTS